MVKKLSFGCRIRDVMFPSLITKLFASKKELSWNLDTLSKSISYRPNSKKEVVLTRSLIRDLMLNTSEEQEIRYCLHQDASKLTQIMFILKFRTLRGRVKKHPDYGKFIYAVRGRAIVKIFDECGRLKTSHLLGFRKMGIYIPAQTWHSCDSSSRKSIVLECVAGPFDKDRSNVFID